MRSEEEITKDIEEVLDKVVNLSDEMGKRDWRTRLVATGGLFLAVADQPRAAIRLIQDLPKMVPGLMVHLLFILNTVGQKLEEADKEKYGALPEVVDDLLKGKEEEDGD